MKFKPKTKEQRNEQSSPSRRALKVSNRQSQARTDEFSTHMSLIYLIYREKLAIPTTTREAKTRLNRTDNLKDPLVNSLTGFDLNW